MKINRLFFCLLSLFLSHASYASSKTTDLQLALSSFIESYGESLAAKGYRFEYTVGSIDPRLTVGKCSENLRLSFVRDPIKQQQNTLKVQCDNAKPWKLFVSAEIRIFGPSIIASETIARNQQITQAMLETKEIQINRSRQAVYDTPNAVIGMIAKKSIRAGLPILPQALRAADLIKRGDKVVISARNQTISIKMNGTALSNGVLGEQISVKNDNSQRIVKATVVDHGKVAVTM